MFFYAYFCSSYILKQKDIRLRKCSAFLNISQHLDDVPYSPLQSLHQDVPGVAPTGKNRKAWASVVVMGIEGLNEAVASGCPEVDRDWFGAILCGCREALDVSLASLHTGSFCVWNAEVRLSGMSQFSWGFAFILARRSNFAFEVFKSASVRIPEKRRWRCYSQGKDKIDLPLWFSISNWHWPLAQSSYQCISSLLVTINHTSNRSASFQNGLLSHCSSVLHITHYPTVSSVPLNIPDI